MNTTNFVQSAGVGGLCVAVSMALISPTVADAGEPQTSQYVQSASVSMEPNYRIDGDEGTVFAGIDECETLVDNDARISTSWQTTVDVQDTNLFGGVYHYRFDRGEESQIACRDADGDLHTDCQGELPDDDVTRTGTDVEAGIDFQTLTGIEETDVCEEEGLDRSHYVQLRIRDYTTAGTTGDWTFDELRVVVDLIRPTAPVLTDVLATESSIRVEFDRSDSADVERHLVFYSSEPFEAGERLEEITDRSPRAVEGETPESGQVSFDLQGGSTVYVGMVSRDRAGNLSTVSNPLEATVVETEGFWDRYVQEGGSETGGYGCVSASNEAPVQTVLWLAAALFLVSVFRRWTFREDQMLGINDEVRG